MIKKKFFAFFALYIIASSSLAFAADPPVFTDGDLDRYKPKSSRNMDMTSPSDSTQTSASKSSAMDPDEWCRRGQEADDRVEVAERNVARTTATASGVTQTYGKHYSGAQGVADAHIAADAAKDELTAARAARERLQQEAQRKNIPAGWLKCNFN